MTKEYAVYKGDDLLCIGTAEECAESLNVAPKTVLFYQYPSYQKRAKNTENRRIAIPLEEDAE